MEESNKVDELTKRLERVVGHLNARMQRNHAEQSGEEVLTQTFGRDLNI